MAQPTRRQALGAAATLGIASSFRKEAMSASSAPDMILHNGRITTLDRAKPAPEAVAITNGRFSAVGDAADILPTAGPAHGVVDLGGKRLIPGLIDNHLHVIRGGLNFNMELRWDGVRSAGRRDGHAEEAGAITPPPQWVRIVGGFTEHQFAEKRLPTLEEINAAAPDTPVFILHLYDRALLNGAALRAVGYTKDTPNPPGGEIQRAPDGTPTGLLLAKPNATILYATLAKGPEAALRLPAEFHPAFPAGPEPARRYRRHRCRRRLAELSGRLRGHPEAGGRWRADGAHRLQPVHPKAEAGEGRLPALDADGNKYQQGDDYFRLNGAGEMLVYSAADFEDFRVERPEMPPRWSRSWSGGPHAGAEPLALAAARDLRPDHQPRAGCLREGQCRDAVRRPALDLRPCRDGQRPSLERIARLGGGVAVQHRMAYQGEYFVERYGNRAAEATPPVAKMLEMGVKVSAGTDATRVASYNPWVALYWMTRARPSAACASRRSATRWTATPRCAC
jgi:hypothetical protein